MIKLIIFDLDGTLLNTLEDLAISTNHALAQNNYPQHELSEYRYFVGNGITKLTERALPEDQRSEETILKVRQDFVNYYSEHNMDRTKPYPGIPELIDQLKKRHICMAVASNKYQAATAKLVAHYFDEGTLQPSMVSVTMCLPNLIQRSYTTSWLKPDTHATKRCM